MQARRGELVDVLEGDGLIAELAGRGVGLIAWVANEDESAEIRAVAVAGDARGQGIGLALFEAAHAAIASAGATTTWLVTTNDNEPAIHLYEALGYVVSVVRPGAVDELRATIKPAIPLVGHCGVEMHDEIELRRPLRGT